MKVRWNPWVAVVAIVCLAGMECVALSNGIDGALFTTVALIIGGIAGYELKRKS